MTAQTEIDAASKQTRAITEAVQSLERAEAQFEFVEARYFEHEATAEALRAAYCEREAARRALGAAHRGAAA
jgi:hypothetical protein